MADRPRRLQDRTRAVASRSSGRHDGGRLCPLTGRVKPALPVLDLMRDLMRERLAPTWCPTCRAQPRSIGTPNRPGERVLARKGHTWHPRVVSLGADHLRADGSCSPLRHDLDDLRALRESGCAPPDEVRSQVQCLFCPAHPRRYALRGHLHSLRSGPPDNARTG
jgi:hypothetical protein